MKIEVTTLKVKKETKDRIDLLRVYKRESYDELLQKILEVMNLVRVNPERAKGMLITIDKDRKRNFKE